MPPLHPSLRKRPRHTGAGLLRLGRNFAVLGCTAFDGGLAMESFINMPPELAYGLSVWRPVAPSFQSVMDNGLPFLRSKARQWPYSRLAGSADGTSERAVTSSVMKACGRSERSAALRMSIFRDRRTEAHAAPPLTDGRAASDGTLIDWMIDNFAVVIHEIIKNVADDTSLDHRLAFFLRHIANPIGCGQRVNAAAG